MIHFLTKNNDFLPYVVKAQTIHGTGKQVILRFPNNYGASIVKHGFSYGDAGELAVIQFNSKNNDDWKITYNTPVTDDVVGCNNADEVRALLNQIKTLEAK